MFSEGTANIISFDPLWELYIWFTITFFAKKDGDIIVFLFEIKNDKLAFLNHAIANVDFAEETRKLNWQTWSIFNKKVLLLESRINESRWIPAKTDANIEWNSEKRSQYLSRRNWNSCMNVLENIFIIWGDLRWRILF